MESGKKKIQVSSPLSKNRIIYSIFFFFLKNIYTQKIYTYTYIYSYTHHTHHKHTQIYTITSSNYCVQYLVLVDNVAVTQVTNEPNEMSFEADGRVGVGAPWPRQAEIMCCSEHIFTGFAQ